MPQAGHKFIDLRGCNARLECVGAMPPASKQITMSALRHGDQPIRSIAVELVDGFHYGCDLEAAGPIVVGSAARVSGFTKAHHIEGLLIDSQILPGIVSVANYKIGLNSGIF